MLSTWGECLGEKALGLHSLASVKLVKTLRPKKFLHIRFHSVLTRLCLFWAEVATVQSAVTHLSKKTIKNYPDKNFLKIALYSLHLQYQWPLKCWKNKCTSVISMCITQCTIQMVSCLTLRLMWNCCVKWRDEPIRTYLMVLRERFWANEIAQWVGLLSKTMQE